MVWMNQDENTVAQKIGICLLGLSDDINELSAIVVKPYLSKHYYHSSSTLYLNILIPMGTAEAIIPVSAIIGLQGLGWQAYNSAKMLWKSPRHSRIIVCMKLSLI